MSHIVIARKYRPQYFEEVVYQEHITATLQNSIKLGRIAHAYLFSGPRGVGKTSMARILARALNCKKGPLVKPCGVCENCLEITDGRSMDVIEIDGASNNSVDNVRDLRENVRFAPVNGKYKIYIIDEVHMLSQSAFNALLKTLEEPPSHVIFILATTEMHKLPATIVSRCQRFQFRRIPYTQLVDSLNSIVHKEGFQVEPEALFWIARRSDGSLRDAQSILEQVFSFSISGKSSTSAEERVIRLANVKELLGIPDYEIYLELLQAISRAEPQVILDLLRKSYEDGVDKGQFLQGFLDFIRIMLLLGQGIEDEQVVQFPREEIEKLKPLIQIFSSEDLHYLFDLFKTLPAEFRYITDDRILVEATFLKAMDNFQRPTIGSLLEKLARALGSGEVSPESGQVKKKEVTHPPQKIAGQANTEEKPVEGEKLNIKVSDKPKEPVRETIEEPKETGKSDLFDAALKMFDGVEITKKERDRIQELWERSN
jgi:DNA polymerase-3 subunit gamma/tau